MITPQWDQGFFDRHQENHQTTIILDRICDPTTDFSTALQNDVEAVDPGLLLFLRQIERIHLRLFTSSSDGVPAISKRFHRVNWTPNSGFVSLKDEDADTRRNLYKHLFTIDCDGTETQRRGITNTDIVLAFPVKNKSGRYVPLIQKTNFVFAYLPLGNFGFRFVIQADFLTTSNRQSVDEDSSWNKNIAHAIPRAFEAAIGKFNGGDAKLDELSKKWPLYLDNNTSGLSAYWRSITESIKKHLRGAIVIKDRTGSVRKPKHLMFLDWAHDSNGEPMFGQMCDYVSPDYPEPVREALLSLGVSAPNWRWVCHRLQELHDESLLHIRGRSKEWYSDLAKVILGPQEPLDHTKYARDLRTIPLIPLADGTWRCPPSECEPIYFPSSLGTTIPPGLPLSLVDAEACTCPKRRKLFGLLGVKDCDAPNVVERIINYHINFRLAKPIHLIAQLKYLYRMQEHLRPGDMDKVYFVCSNSEGLRRGTSTYVDTSISGELQQLFSGYSEAYFLDSRYFAEFGSSDREKLAEWLADTAGVALVPRFNVASGLHRDFKWLLKRKSNQILAILYQYWDCYKENLTNAANPGFNNQKDVDKSRQLYLAIQSRAFSPTDERKVKKAFGNQLVNLPNDEYKRLRSCVWHGPKDLLSKPALYPVYGHGLDRLFREILEVPDATCAETLEYLETLRNNESTTMADVAEAYVFLQNYHADTFSVDDKTACIAVPSSGSALEWKTPAQCVWDDDEFSQNGLELESKMSIRSTIENHAPTAKAFFTKLLKLPNAGIRELLADLALMQETKRDAPKRVYRLYERVESCRRSWPERIRHVSTPRMRQVANRLDRKAFKKRPLVFLRGMNDQNSQCVSIEDCIWTRSVLWYKHALMPSLNQYRGLFRDALEVPNATMDMLVTELLEPAMDMEDKDGYQHVKELLQEIARLRPNGRVLERLDGKDCWPCRTPTCLHGLCSMGSFYVNDRQDLFGIFTKTHTFLDFDFNASRKLADLLCNRGCDSFLSEKVSTEIEFSEPLEHDHDLMQDFRLRADALVKYFEYAECESPYELRPLLENVEVWMSEDIETHYTLEDTTVTKSGGGSGVKVSIGVGKTPKLDIYVSTNKHVRSCALITDVPKQLVEALKLELADLSDLHAILQVPPASLEALLIKRGITGGDASDDDKDTLVAQLINEDWQIQSDDSSGNNTEDASTTSASSVRPDSARSAVIEYTSASAASRATHTTQRSNVHHRSSFRPTTPRPDSQDPLHEPAHESPTERPVTSRRTAAGLYNIYNRRRNMERLQSFAQNANPTSHRPERSNRQSGSSGGAFNLSMLRETLEAAGPAPVSMLVPVDPYRRRRTVLIPNRNDEEMARDFEVGFLGEQFVSALGAVICYICPGQKLTLVEVYTLLHDTLELPDFTGEDNWTSSLRSRAGFPTFGCEVSDFTYKDTQGALTSYFLQMQHPSQKHNEPGSQYHLLFEWRSVQVGRFVKSWSNSADFWANTDQAKKLRVTSATPSEVYVILRISGLDALEDGAGHRPECRVYLDPYTRGEEGILDFVAPTYAVTATT
ncbi:hypothetical protein MAA_01614 [Metarhizium robertsii ARSEF 23]|uniref:Uncharacterized protein n=1 Tax=Metarhizium robertsii (strain ARSEF 23 / ATCC MYA-3075) TaxID=655844 RepID=E9ENL5_METRA|nr:uncharacterized protein MAA_01614 [Metarhizium robertsii ARSEF 23]EFZ02032.1 hypothetical protein MAA_01614 [Metarhizium robertsii ARSEF 23]